MPRATAAATSGETLGKSASNLGGFRCTTRYNVDGMLSAENGATPLTIS